MTGMNEINPSFVYDEIDERVWREELDAFVPPRVFDIHGRVSLRNNAERLVASEKK
jgi:hypothetical protein